MYLIQNATSPDGFSRVSRPTLTSKLSVGANRTTGFWQQDGTFGGDWLVVSGAALYRIDKNTFVSTIVGSVPGTGFAQFAGNVDRVLIVRDGILYSTDGSSISLVVIPDDQSVRSVACIDSTFIFTILDSQRFYWITPSEVDPDPLNFASAERTPDPLESVVISSDEIWFLGTSGDEVWQTTGDLNAPYQRIPNRVYNEGCASRDTVVNTTFNSQPALIWVTTTGTVVMAQGIPKKISDGTIEEKLKSATNLRAWSFRSTKNDFYVLTADEFTEVYDISNNKWMRWDSYLNDSWKAHLGIQTNNSVYAASSIDGTIWVLEEGVADDDDPVIRELSGFVDDKDLPVQCKSLSVRVNAGWSPVYGFIPVLEVRWSEDMAVTWSDYIQIELGDKGKYNQDTILRSLGLMERPGRVFEFRFSDKARFRLDYATVNEV